MAVGEAACVSVHGANRLGSNSLLDLVVFGREAARRCAETRRRRRHAPATAGGGGGPCGRAGSIASATRSGSRRTADLRLEMQRVMQNHAAVFRTGESLAEGVRKLAEVRASFDDVKVSDRGADLEHGPDRDTRARQSARAGDRDDQFGREPPAKAAVHTRATTSRNATIRSGSSTRWPGCDADGQVRIDYRPVHLNTLTSDVEPIPPKARTY